ncbi:MAG: ISAs1 family transposase, partial [Lachnospiraceae bacterium]|nr:ISAs1 family transposase [Lachnospiraceae bacterium]
YTRYMIISDGKMSAKTFGDSQRGHWGIENQLHWCLDIAFNEDSCRMRSKNVAENMNLIRHIALNLLKQEKSVKMGLKSKRKKCGWDKEYL